MHLPSSSAAALCALCVHFVNLRDSGPSHRATRRHACLVLPPMGSPHCLAASCRWPRGLSAVTPPGRRCPAASGWRALQPERVGHGQKCRRKRQLHSLGTVPLASRDLAALGGAPKWGDSDLNTRCAREVVAVLPTIASVAAHL